MHLGGPLYFQRLAEVAAQGYKGFVLEKERRRQATTLPERSTVGDEEVSKGAQM